MLFHNANLKANYIGGRSNETSQGLHCQCKQDRGQRAYLPSALMKLKGWGEYPSHRPTVKKVHPGKELRVKTQPKEDSPKEIPLHAVKDFGSVEGKDCTLPSTMRTQLEAYKKLSEVDGRRFIWHKTSLIFVDHLSDNSAKPSGQYFGRELNVLMQIYGVIWTGWGWVYPRLSFNFSHLAVEPTSIP